MERVILLADKQSKSWEFTQNIQKYIQEEKGVLIPILEVQINHFRNSEIDMHIPENIRKMEVYFVHDSTKDPQEWWIELLLLQDLLFTASAESACFVLPNMLYSRKDRKEKSRVPISARALANSLSVGLKRIITMDLHASQIQGFYSSNLPLDNLYSFFEVVRYFKESNSIGVEELVVVSPDAGGAERAESFAKRLGTVDPIAVIDKRRIQAGQIADMRLAGDVAGKNCLIVDDMIDSGGTACEAALLLRKLGAKKIFLYGTHGLFTKGTGELFESFDRVVTTNTHHQKEAGVEVVDVSQIFAEAIYRTQIGESLSALFV